MSRFYDKRVWRRLRRQKLAEQPFCEHCRPTGRLTPATQVDHVVAIERGGEPLDMDNLESLCGTCHSRKTSFVEVHGHDRVPIRGVDPETGRPVDPGHWWNK